MDIPYLRLFLPALIGFTVSSLCRFSRIESNTIDIAPPAFVFSIVWPLLYLIIGYAWETEYKNKYVDYVFLINMIFSGLWIYLFNCKNNKRLSLYLLLIIIASSIMMIQTSNKLINKILLSFYTTWLLFAMLMNSRLISN